MIAQSASKSSTIGASLGCSATAASTRPGNALAISTHHCDCSAEYPTCTMRSTLTDLASSRTFLTASESGASSVTISRCACASTVGTGSGSGSGASSRSISRLWRSAIENYSLTSNRGKSTGVFVTVAPCGSWPHVATLEIS